MRNRSARTAQQLVFVAGLLLVAGSAAAAPRFEASPPDPIEGTVAGTYPGRNGCLPYGGTVTDSQILAAALALPSTQVAIEGFVQAGYLRRADLDAAFNSTGGATVTLGFQIPGVPIDEAEPMVMILTREAQDRYFTQVLGMTLRRTAEGLVLPDTNDVHSFYVEPVYPPGAVAPEGLGMMSTNFSAAHDLKSGKFLSPQTFEFMRQNSRCWMAAVRRLALEVAVGAGFGALNGARAGGVAAAYSAVVGAASAMTRWHMNPPQIQDC